MNTDTTNATTNLQPIQRFSLDEWEQLPEFARERLAFLAPVLPPIPQAGDPTPYIYADEDGQPSLLAFRSRWNGDAEGWDIQLYTWSGTHWAKDGTTVESEDTLRRKVADLTLWNPQTPLASTEPEPAAEPAA